MKKPVAWLGVLGAIAGAIALDHVAPARPPAGRGIEVRTQGGALACPIAVADRGVAYLHFANFGDAPSRVRVSLIPMKGKTVGLSAIVQPGNVGALRLSGRVRGAASAVVEYAGGEVVASHLLLQTQSGMPKGIAEAPCVRTAGPDVAVLPLRTLHADTTLAVFNPGSAAADVSIALVTDKQILRPERLSHRVIPGRSRRDFVLGDFAFDSASVVAELHATTGRVVAEALMSSAQGIELIPGQYAAPAIVAPSGISGAGAATTVVPFGDAAALDAVLATAHASAVARAPATIDPAVGATLAVPPRDGGRPAAYVLTARAGAPLLAGTIWPNVRSFGRDISILPATASAMRWGAVGGIAGRSGSLDLLIACPGAACDRIHVVVAGEKRDSVFDLRAGAGRFVSATIGKEPGTYGALVTSDQPITVALRGISADRVRGVLADGIAATPLRAPTAVAPQVDTRAGVPAPLLS